MSSDVSRRFVVREGTEADVAACVAIAVDIGLGEPAAWHETLLKTVNDGLDRVLFVAEVDSAVAGYGRAVRAGSPADPEGWYLLGVGVSEGWRRRGIGEALTRARMDWVARRSDCVYYFAAGPFVPPAGTATFAETQPLYSARL